jgi:hypothetical protein
LAEVVIAALEQSPVAVVSCVSALLKTPRPQMQFDSIEFDPFRFAYLVRRGKQRWEVSLDLIRSIKDPDFLDAVNAAAETAWKEGRVSADELPGASAPRPRGRG